ncbi:MAG: (2Fe-2S)-binding protein [Lentimicrobiaceae bacterium]|nr:(2Fe-2S)-binding protein [Lentimicrobiaceae bacterium]
MIFDIEVNGKTIKARRGEMILEALERNGIAIPTLCHMKGLSPSGACRMCVVEVEGVKELVTSCSQPVEEWMKITTHSPRVVHARKTIVELLLANHPDDCLYCVRNGMCELQDMASEHHIMERRFPGKRLQLKTDPSSSSLTRDPAKCILCGRCIRTCDEVMGITAIDFTHRGNQTIIGTTAGKGLNLSSCITCGQCIMACPTGALHEKEQLSLVQQALHRKDSYVTISYSPTLAVSIGEMLGLKSGKDLSGMLNAALRKAGFRKVFNNVAASDINISLVADLVVQRLKKGIRQPLFSSCCPAWVKMAEQFYPELIPQLTPVKSPQQLMGGLVKSYLVNAPGVRPDQIFHVAAMPCTAKKFEAQREEMTHKGISDVDAVLTTRELVRLIKLYGIHILQLEPEAADDPSAAGGFSSHVTGMSGGVAESVLRDVYFKLTGKEIALNKLGKLRSQKSYKELIVKAGPHEIGVAVVNGSMALRQTIASLKDRKDLLFIEVMACEGGCVAGGGQPLKSDEDDIRNRARALADLDSKATMRAAGKQQLIEPLQQGVNTLHPDTGWDALCKTIFAKRSVI